MNGPENDCGSPTFLLSVVSHGQGELIRSLLDDIAPFVGDHVTVVITLNIPEAEGFLSGLAFPVHILRNDQPKGFGANHNCVSRLFDADYFVVLNPDIRCDPSAFGRLAVVLGDPRIAVASPLVQNAAGVVEDSARCFPTAGRIVWRVARRMRGLPTEPDYRLSQRALTRVEWVAGMFMLFRKSAYHAIGGFDERYFMYLEDADICRRLHFQGWEVVVLSEVKVVHDARRASHRSLKHLRWHILSLFRYLVTRNPTA